MAERIMVDGDMLYRGHRWAWRRGVIVAERAGVSIRGDLPRPAGVTVRLERRGRERHGPSVEVLAAWLLVRTPALEDALAAAGVLDGWDDAEGAVRPLTGRRAGGVA